MNRKLFFWLERLSITPQERITVAILLALLLILTLLNSLIGPNSTYGPSHYREVEAEFRERSALQAERRKRIFARYHPLPSGERSTVVAGAQDDTAAVSMEEPEAGKININTADFGQLQALPGIGPSYARRIIEYRSRHGSFRTIEELKEIRGIGEKRLEALRPYVAI